MLQAYFYIKNLWKSTPKKTWLFCSHFCVKDQNIVNFSCEMKNET
jgi:hypothetical protein